jgi:hypothetical protein
VLDVDQWPALREAGNIHSSAAHEECSSAMRLYSYRDESHARHFDLIAGGLLIN